MLNTSHQEAIEALKVAKNLNAAIKNVLKREGGNHDDLVRFAKDFRSAIMSGFGKQAEFFIEKNFRAKEPYFNLIARYAHADPIGTICDPIVNQYSDAFNATYSKNQGGITVSNPSTFKEIVRSVIDTVKNGLVHHNLPTSHFLINTVIMSIFDDEVIQDSHFGEAAGF